MATTGASGAFAVLLNSLTWRLNSAPAKEANFYVYGFVQLVQPSEQLLDNVWFAAEDENMMTRSLLISANDDGQMLQLDYNQSSRAVPLTSEAMQELVQAQLLLSLYSGTARVRDTDSLLSKALVPMKTALLEGKLKHKLQLTSVEETFVIELDVLCDVALADFMLGARMLQLYSPRILNLPAGWTATECMSNEEAVQYCASKEQNTACYELTIALPRLEDTKSPLGGGGGMKGALSSSEVNLTTWKGGKLHFQPTRNGSEKSKLNQLAATGGKRPDERPAISVSATTGNWSVRFPSTTIMLVLYLKRSVTRLVDFLTVEKHVNGILRRSVIENVNGEAVDAVSSEFCLNLNEFLAPGITQCVLKNPLRAMSPVSRAYLEKSLASAASNDDKKKFQAAIADYETIVAEAASLTAAATTAGTHIEIVADILSAPLVLKPPKMLDLPSISIAQLIPPRDVINENEKRRDVYGDLRTEIRLVVICLLSEYKDLLSGSNSKQEMDDFEAAAPRDIKKQTLIYQLNTQGIYHSFKESLKKRIVPIVREVFARNDFVSDENVENGQVEPDERTVREKGREQLGQLYSRLMHEINTTLNETFYLDSNALLEKVNLADERRPTLEEMQSVLEVLRIKALENEVKEDFEKSEMLHLDRIAYADQHAAHHQNLFQSQKLTDNVTNSKFQSLTSAWYEYALFCISQTKLEKAAAALLECLRLDSDFLRAVIDLIAVQCELRDFARAEVLVKNAVIKAKAAIQPSLGDGTKHSALAHALFAYIFSQFEEKDPTGNFMLYELLKAQQILQARNCSDELNDASCVSAVWVILAKYAYEYKLWGIMQRSLHLADRHMKAHDVLSSDLRVMKRAMEAELLLKDNEFGKDAGESLAIKLLQEALEVDSSHPIAWFTLGKIYLRQDSQIETAIECLQRAFEHRQALKLDALRLNLYLRLSLAFLHSSQFEKAEAVFLLACDEFRVASCWLGVGIASLRLEKWERAQMALAEANRLDFSNPDVWGFLALLALTAHTSVSSCNEIDASRFVSQALRYGLSNPALLRELSNAFVAIDRLECAERLLRRSLACQDSSLTRKTLADVLAAQNCAEDALRQYTRLLEVTEGIKDRCALLENCARLLIILGRPEEASEYRKMSARFQTDD